MKIIVIQHRQADQYQLRRQRAMLNRIHSNDESNKSIDDFFSWIQHTTEIVVIICCNKSTKSIAQKNKLEKVTKF